MIPSRHDGIGVSVEGFTGGKREMNVLYAIGWLALWLFAAGGCAVGPNVVTGSDPTTDFSSFRTFAFSGIMDRGHEVAASDRSPLRGRIKEMIRKQFATKGVQQVGVDDHPDLLVHLFYGVKDFERRQKVPAPLGFSSQTKTYEMVEGNWVPVPTKVMVHEGHEGTLIVDLAESSKMKLVWRAVISTMLDESLQKNFALADKGIAEAFKDYPSAK